MTDLATPELPVQLTPVSWLLGTWEGVGVVGYPTMTERQFGQRVTFSHDGRGFLQYESRAWLLDESGEPAAPSGRESGFWRVIPAADPEQAAKDAAGVDLEVCLCHPTGIVEIYLGKVLNGRIDLATDMVGRTATAKEYSGATRQYGLVDGQLLWVMDMIAMGQPLKSHTSAKLTRVG